MYRPNPIRFAALLSALFGASVGNATPAQVHSTEQALKRENVNNFSHRGVGPWINRSAGWRQAQRRKLARRTER